jgi:hypothetical protein
MRKICVLVFALLVSRSALAQETGAWQPSGPVPVDEAGVGRGYTLPPSGADVSEPGDAQLSFHTVAANNFYHEETGSFLINQRSETHTMAIGYRRGFKRSGFPRFELGGQVQINERDNGFLNGFVGGFEDLWTSMTGSTSAKNQLRTAGGPILPLGMTVANGGAILYQTTGASSGLGDVTLTAKAVVRDASSSRDARVAVRAVLNIAGQSDFTKGTFTGAGLSIDKPLGRRFAFHGDARAAVMLDRMSSWNFPLKRTTLGFSAGPELRVGDRSSVSLQFDGNTTPYLFTGTSALDEAYGDVTFGFSHLFAGGTHPVLAQFYARENLNLPFRVRWNTDPDFLFGVKISIFNQRRR